MRIKRGNIASEIIWGNNQCRDWKEKRMVTGVVVLLKVNGTIYYKGGKWNYSFEWIERKTGWNI